MAGAAPRRLLTPGSQLSIDQHRFILEAPCPDLGVVDEPLPEPVEEVPIEPEQESIKPRLIEQKPMVAVGIRHWCISGNYPVINIVILSH